MPIRSFNIATFQEHVRILMALNFCVPNERKKTNKTVENYREDTEVVDFEQTE